MKQKILTCPVKNIFVMFYFNNVAAFKPSKNLFGQRVVEGIIFHIYVGKGLAKDLVSDKFIDYFTFLFGLYRESVLLDKWC